MSNNSVENEIGNYRILKEIDSGAYGTVYQGEHIVFSGKIVAIKLLHARRGSPEERERFLREARILEKLRHPHIVSIIDAGLHENRFPYLISDYAPGGSLRNLLKRHGKRPLPFPEALRILAQIAEGLAYAHQKNIVHRDLKPENILFQANGEALLADFGMATALATGSIQHPTGVAGTPRYMAPEQFKGTVSRRSDQYALGCIAYELVTGQAPFAGAEFYALAFKHVSEPPPDPMYLNPQVPVQMAQALMKALAKEREDRYPDVSSFMQALAQAVLPLKSKEVYLEEALAYQERDLYIQSLLAYEQVLQIDKDLALAHSGKALVLYHLGRSTEALETIERALHLAPRNATSHYGRGLILERLQRDAEALLAYQQALQLEPGYTQVQQQRERVLLKIRSG